MWRSESRDRDNLNGHSLEQNERERREREVIEERRMSPVDQPPAPLSSAPWRQRARMEASASSGRTLRSAPKPEEHPCLSEDLQITEQSRESAISDRFFPFRSLCVWSDIHYLSKIWGH